jgi:positive regulator of sigma E activity
MDASRAARCYYAFVLSFLLLMLCLFIVSITIGDDIHAIVAAMLAFAVVWVVSRDHRHRKRQSKSLD